jgi:UDP-N-acetylglucosamine 2-epimerase (non-hydrolysing)
MKRKQIKVIIVIGTRPEAIKMCPVIYEFNKKKDIFKTVVLVTGQHREMLSQVLNLFKVAPNYDLCLMEKNQSLSGLTSKAIPAMEKVIKKERPDLLLVQGDTTTSFVASLAAFYQNVSVGHIEAGLRTYKKYYPFPEEMNRKLITALSDINFAPTRSSAENLKKEGVDPRKIYITGNTVIDALFYIIKHAMSTPSTHNDNSRHILLTAHRRENFGEPMKNICNAIIKLIKLYSDIEITYPVHKNPNVRNIVYDMLSGVERVNLVEPVDYLECVNLMKNSYFILTDSGGIQEEAPSLGKPVLVLRNETERPEAVEAGTVKIVGTNMDSIISNSITLLDNKEEYIKMANAINPYGDGTSSRQIVNILQSELA